MYLLVCFSNFANKNNPLYLHVLGKKELQISSLSPPLIYLVIIIFFKGRAQYRQKFENAYRCSVYNRNHDYVNFMSAYNIKYNDSLLSLTRALNFYYRSRKSLAKHECIILSELVLITFQATNIPFFLQRPISRSFLLDNEVV